MFQGRFAPPSIGTSGTPIPLAGDGTIELTDAGLAVEAFRARGGAAIALLTFVVTLGAGLGGAWLVTKAMGSTVSSGVLGGVIAGAVLVAAAIPRTAKRDHPWKLVFPWTTVRKVALNKQTKAVIVTIKQHKPKGQLHFMPSSDAQAIVTAIEARRYQ